MVFGCIWFAEEDIMPGRFMAGQIQWPIFGVTLLVAGVSLLLSSRRRRLRREVRERSKRLFQPFLGE